MICRHLLASSAVVLALSATVLADLPVVWKFAKGQTFEVERTASQKLSVDLKGEKFKQEQASTWLIRVDVLDKRGDQFAVRATLVKVEHTLPGADGVDPKLAAKMQGSVFDLEVTASGRIAGMKGYDDFVKRVSENDPARRKAIRATLPEAALKQALADVFGPLPPDKDATWEREITEPIPHFGSLKRTIHYEYVGEKKSRDLINYKGKTKYVPPAKADMAIFRVTKGVLDADDTQGMITFDKEAGRLVNHDTKSSVRGTLSIEFMDRNETAAFSVEAEVKIRLKK